MIHKFAIPLVAAGMLIFAFAHAIYIQQPEPDSPPPVAPPSSPFGNTVAGAGMIEPSNEASTNSWIAIGSQLSGVVTKISIRIGQTVKTGDLLFGFRQTGDRSRTAGP